jgi:signal transduction histidine kinase
VTLSVAIGYAFVSFATYAWNRAETARRESQALLTDLQTAHRQLQDYADQVEKLAVAEERYRLAREMHDTLGHRLTVTAVQLEGAQRLIPSDPERAARMVGTVRDQVREALSELRRTVATLRTPLEAGLSLPHALARLATGFEEATDLTVHLTLAEEMPALPDSHRLALYRAAQEALTNVQRHAQAQDVWLQSAWRDEEVVLLVSDDGVGFPPIAEQRGFGLRGLMERATQLGGEFTLESRPSGGARLSFRLPLPTEETNG